MLKNLSEMLGKPHHTLIQGPDSDYLAMSENDRLSGKNTKYDLEIATSRFFQKFRRIAVFDFLMERENEFSGGRSPG
jgi:hypothetical protein